MVLVLRLGPVSSREMSPMSFKTVSKRERERV